MKEADRLMVAWLVLYDMEQEDETKMLEARALREARNMVSKRMQKEKADNPGEETDGQTA